jgi:hypothetical protein
LPTLLAAILPGGTLGVALCAAFVCGTAMESIAHRLLVRGMRTLVAGLLVASVIGIPAVCFEATQNLAGFAALAFLVLALDGFVRFAVRGDTLGGFAAGLLLAAAFLCDPVALVYALALGIAAPLLAADRFRREPTAARATALVLTFPTIATAGAWMFLEWRFTGGVFATLRADHQVLVFPRGAVNELGHAARDTGAVLLRSPLYLVIAAVMTRRRHPALAAYLLPVPALVVATWLGMWPSAALSFALFGMVALASAPRPTRHLVPLLVAAAIAQIAVAGAWAPAGVEFHSWVASLR